MSEIYEDLDKSVKISELLSIYKERKLAEMCVERDEIIERITEENKKLAGDVDKLKDVKTIYKHIKSLSVDEYMEMYHLFKNDVEDKRYGCVSTVTPLTIGGTW